MGSKPLKASPEIKRVLLAMNPPRNNLGELCEEYLLELGKWVHGLISSKDTETIKRVIAKLRTLKNLSPGERLTSKKMGLKGARGRPNENNLLFARCAEQEVATAINDKMKPRRWIIAKEIAAARNGRMEDSDLTNLVKHFGLQELIQNKKTGPMRGSKQTHRVKRE